MCPIFAGVTHLSGTEAYPLIVKSGERASFGCGRISYVAVFTCPLSDDPKEVGRKSTPTGVLAFLPGRPWENPKTSPWLSLRGDAFEWYGGY